MIARLLAGVTILASTCIAPGPASAGEALVPVLDDTIHLNIAERRIERGPYEASLQVGIDRPVFVRVGVSVSTDRIAVTLRGVRGDGRFHGDLSRLTRVITTHSGRAVSDREKLPS